MKEEHLDEMIRKALVESRRPPEPALDEMWAHIERKAFDEPAHNRIAPLPMRWNRIRRWAAPTIAAAAALTIGVGIGWSVAPRGSVVTRIVRVPAQSVAVAPTAAPPTDRNANADASTGNLSTSTNVATHAAFIAGASHVAAQPAVALLATRFDDADGSDVSRYLVRTAALLQALPADRTTTRSDSAIANRAAELLTQTHLLLDSKAGSDPTLHRLLEDLELVLAQVARLKVQQSGSDLQLIHQALAVRDVLPRVHDATVEASISE